jgi:protein-S-isoprenylcysteine O-methyltransferase Ste14
MLIFKLIAGVILNVLIFGVLLFLPAGTLDWPRAWVFLGVVFILAALTMFVVYDKPALVDERYGLPIQKGQPLADKILTVLLIATFAGVILFIPLDVFRFRLLGAPGLAVSILGLGLFIAGWSMLTLSFKENDFAAPVVKHQQGRQQTVIDSGVYGIVRHPMYAGGVLLFVGMPLLLGSYAAVLAAIVPIGVLIVRITIEERFLRQELKGYDAYMRKVRWRLIPFVW